MPEYIDPILQDNISKDQIVHALNVALVTMTARLESHQELIETLMRERMMVCETHEREVP